MKIEAEYENVYVYYDNRRDIVHIKNREAPVFDSFKTNKITDSDFHKYLEYVKETMLSFKKIGSSTVNRMEYPFVHMRSSSIKHGEYPTFYLLTINLTPMGIFHHYHADKHLSGSTKNITTILDFLKWCFEDWMEDISYIHILNMWFNFKISKDAEAYIQFVCREKRWFSPYKKHSVRIGK